MSSLKSQFRQHTQQQPQDRNIKPSQHGSRIPTKSINMESGGKPSGAVQHVSRLAKRAGKSIASPEPSVESSTTRTAAPATTVAQGAIGSSRRRSVTPSGHTQPSAPPNIRTPSLVSGSSVSTFESPRSLRRKPSGAIDRYALQKRTVSSSELEQDRNMAPGRNVSNREALDTTVLGISLPPMMEYDQHDAAAVDTERVAHEINVNRNFTPPVLGGYPPTATPSTRYTDSPFSHIPTPSSASSYSPGLLVTSGAASRPRTAANPTRSRPALSSSRQPSKDESSKLRLFPVRESSTSSSNATVRPDLKFAPAVKTQRTRTSDYAAAKASEDASGSLVRSPQNKSKSSSSPPVKHSVQVPPEFAHLVEDVSPPKASKGKSRPPTRPTRDGTPTISDMSSPSPVVQSDLPRLYTTYHKRGPSQETPVSGGSLNRKTRFGFSSRSSSRTESSRIDSAISPPPAARNFHHGSSTELPRKEPTKLRRKDSPVIPSGPSPSKAPRFSFFSRKSKSEPAQVLQKPNRRPSKGPTAGTGHEGYGRFSARSRSGSISSSTGLRSSSIESGSSGAAQTSISTRPRQAPNKKSSTTNKDGSELDDFLKERLNPVVLRGSGSTFSATASSSDLPGMSLHPTSSKSSSLDSFPQPHLLPSALRAVATGSPVRRPPEHRLRRPSDSSDDDIATRYSSLATRRSLTRMSSSGSRSPVRIPPPINTSIPARSTTLDSYEADVSAWPQTDSTLPLQDCASFAGEGGEGHWLRSPVAQSPVKTGRKWNFFERATSSPLSEGKGKERANESHDTSKIVTHRSPYLGLAHYAVLGPVEPVGLEEVKRIAQENELPSEDAMSMTNAPSRMVPYERRHSSLLPSPPKPEYSSDSDAHARSMPPKIMVHRQDSAEDSKLFPARSALPQQTAQTVKMPRSSADESVPVQIPGFVTPDLPSTNDDTEEALQTPEQTKESPRQPRLSPVGRIPAVVSKRDRDRRLPDNSFSRPFAHSQPRPSVKPPGAIYSQIRDMASPIESGSQPVSSTSTRSEATSTGYKSSTFANLPSASTNRTSMEIYAAQNEFFSFPPRKDSEQSYSSSSGPPSWMTAVYSQPPQQEDIWNEYNDLIDEVMPVKTPTTGSSLGAPFQYSNFLHDGSYSSLTTPTAPGLPPTSELPLPPAAGKPLTTVLTVPQQISRFLQPSLSPLSPDSLSHFVSDYGNRSTSTLYTGNRVSIPSQPRTSLQQPARSSFGSGKGSITSSRNSRSSGHSRSNSLPDGPQRQSQSSLTQSTRFNRDTQFVDISEIPSTATERTSPNLRVGALMTSKWLSFGRVLFSPAHHELRFTDEAKILVIDGLSSDWSYYVALSYPSVQVYNLTPSLPSSPSFTWPETTQEPPSNHHQVPLVNIATPFPYPKGFFTAVLFRFPTATTEAAYAACISECKRVLRPGGYLEVAVLDLDLMNMGAKVRKAVRGLKTRMQSRDQNVCLRNLSDILVRLIGRRNFEAVQRCIVGVPAAGRIPRSQDLSSASSDSGKPIWHREARTSKSQEFSFADLLEDAKNNQFGDGKSNDETITKMVAKVGRCWYSSCYEKSLLPRDQSIWTDPTLLRECERQGTSFRLLICHAQKPTQTRRRTVSV